MLSVAKTTWNKVYSIHEYSILINFKRPVVFGLVKDLTPDRNQANIWIKVYLQKKNINALSDTVLFNFMITCGKIRWEMTSLEKSE